MDITWKKITYDVILIPSSAQKYKIEENKDWKKVLLNSQKTVAQYKTRGNKQAYLPLELSPTHMASSSLVSDSLVARGWVSNGVPSSSSPLRNRLTRLSWTWKSVSVRHKSVLRAWSVVSWSDFTFSLGAIKGSLDCNNGNLQVFCYFVWWEKPV